MCSVAHSQQSLAEQVQRGEHKHGELCERARSKRGCTCHPPWRDSDRTREGVQRQEEMSAAALDAVAPSLVPVSLSDVASSAGLPNGAFRGRITAVRAFSPHTKLAQLVVASLDASDPPQTRVEVELKGDWADKPSRRFLKGDILVLRTFNASSVERKGKEKAGEPAPLARIRYDAGLTGWLQRGGVDELLQYKSASPEVLDEMRDMICDNLTYFERSHEQEATAAGHHRSFRAPASTSSSHVHPLGLAITGHPSITSGKRPRYAHFSRPDTRRCPWFSDFLRRGSSACVSWPAIGPKGQRTRRGISICQASQAGGKARVGVQGGAPQFRCRASAWH